MVVYTATLRGYTFGCGQEWDWDGGLPSGIGPGDYSTARSAKIGLDGVAVEGGDYAGAGVLQFPLIYDTQPGTASDVELAAQRVRAAFKPEHSNDVLEMAIEMASGSYVVRGRPMKPVTDLSQAYTRLARALVSFETTDPLWYNANPSSVTVGFGGTSGGLDTPLVTPLVTTGSGSTGDAAVVSNGTAEVDWTITINGPVTRPWFMLGGRTIYLDGADIPAGSQVVVSSVDGSVISDGQPRPWVRWDSDWWLVPPGTSTFSARAVAGSGSATLSWRDGTY